jgi:hypothetical protein
VPKSKAFLKGDGLEYEEKKKSPLDAASDS